MELTVYRAASSTIDDAYGALSACIAALRQLDADLPKNKDTLAGMILDDAKRLRDEIRLLGKVTNQALGSAERKAVGDPSFVAQLRRQMDLIGAR